MCPPTPTHTGQLGSRAKVSPTLWLHGTRITFSTRCLPQKHRRLEPFPITGSIERVPTFDFPLTSLCFLVHFAAFRNSEYIFIEEFRIKYFARFSLALCSVFIGSHRPIILAISPLASSDFLFFP